MKLKLNPEAKSVFDNYPDHIRGKMVTLRKLILETAQEIDGITLLEETLKWGEPSYLVKGGSTVRIDWKPKTPDQYAIYFKCTSRLVKTFQNTYAKVFRFEGNRAIVFKLDEQIPRDELKSCIRTALTYHKVKHLPTLGL